MPCWISTTQEQVSSLITNSFTTHMVISLKYYITTTTTIFFFPLISYYYYSSSSSSSLFSLLALLLFFFSYSTTFHAFLRYLPPVHLLHYYCPNSHSFRVNSLFRGKRGVFFPPSEKLIQTTLEHDDFFYFVIFDPSLFLSLARFILFCRSTTKCHAFESTSPPTRESFRFLFLFFFITSFSSKRKESVSFSCRCKKVEQQKQEANFRIFSLFS